MSELEFIDIFADNLKYSIEKSGKSISDIARDAKISKYTIYRYLKKERIPSITAVVNLSIALLCNVNDLIPDYDKVY